MPVNVKITTTWDDQRFPTEMSWLKYSEIKNLNEN